MKNLLLILITSVIIISLIAGCGSGSRMHQTKIKTRGGLPRMVPQVEDPTKIAGGIIEITDEMKYPGMTPYEDAKYDFVAGDPPEKVAKWFEANLKGCTINKRTGSKPQDIKYEISWKDYIIDIVVGPHGNDSLIRYKKNLKTKK